MGDATPQKNSALAGILNLLGHPAFQGMGCVISIILALVFGVAGLVIAYLSFPPVYNYIFASTPTAPIATTPLTTSIPEISSTRFPVVPSNTPIIFNFIIEGRAPQSECFESGDTVEVKPRDPLILGIGIAGCTPISSSPLHCKWSADNGDANIDKQNGCSEVTYRAPSKDTDIITVSVSNGTSSLGQYSLKVLVR